MISIVTPVYNAINFIDNTIDMVMSQTYTDWEWILVEDGSTDGTREKLVALMNSPDFDRRIKIILFDENENGAAGARNRGLDEVTGRFVAFLDADDVWMPDKLEKQLTFMEQRDAAFSFTSYEFGDADANGTGRYVRVPEVLTYKKALSRTVIFTTTTMFDTEKIDIRLIHMPLVASEDTATWWQILRTGVNAYGLDEVLAIYRRPAQSLSSNKMLAIKRIWFLYRKMEKLNPIVSAFYFCGWAVRATLRRI
ncbi:MAG: glycosyltransferase family 2 protein [Lachnospiraceae bacterium]|nr:glycosyltransferase family 2 protein [Candidatus Colinaster scatohippi]